MQPMMADTVEIRVRGREKASYYRFVTETEKDADGNEKTTERSIFESFSK
jgi:hypothetical protein